ncbi:hypothetical protein SEA_MIDNIGHTRAIN_76 [Arthrobacter phage MidnightRain]|nr:hypothetical protein SEA_MIDNIGHTRAIN_76 [Arthrobacter phage MidnightRain]
MKRTIAIAAVLTAGLLSTAAACDSDAKKASENTSTAADNFEVQRKIVGVNTRTDKYLFYVEGRCSIEREGDLVIICKHGENDYRKHYIGKANDVAWVVTQEKGIDVSVYHTRIIIKPENLLPSLELSAGKQ